jgi:hypothetical protein
MKVIRRLHDPSFVPRQLVRHVPGAPLANQGINLTSIFKATNHIISTASGPCYPTKEDAHGGSVFRSYLNVIDFLGTML